jgi:hypothetical protein
VAVEKKLKYLKGLSIFEPVDVHAGVTQGDNAAFHVCLLALGNDSRAGQRRNKDGFVERLLIVGNLMMKKLQCFLK